MRGLGFQSIFIINGVPHFLVYGRYAMASQSESDSTGSTSQDVSEAEASSSSRSSRCVYAKQDSETVAGKKKRCVDVEEMYI